MIGKHTPSPWKVSASIENDFIGIFPDTGEMAFPICKMPDFVKREVNEANARLIATAPELKDAAVLAMEGIEVIDLLIASVEQHGNYSVESTLGFLNQARCAKLRLTEAIAKATGEQP